jgi:hypothetical protein
MRVTPTAVRQLAANSGLPGDVVDRYLEEFINLTFAIARRERKHCYKTVRNWVYDPEIRKMDILEVLKPTIDEEEVYDIL